MSRRPAVTKGVLQERFVLLMQFVERYARHDTECPAYAGGLRCTCGFTAMLYQVRNGFLGENLAPPKQPSLLDGEQR